MHLFTDSLRRLNLFRCSLTRSIHIISYTVYIQIQTVLTYYPLIVMLTYCVDLRVFTYYSLIHRPAYLFTPSAAVAVRTEQTLPLTAKYLRRTFLPKPGVGGSSDVVLCAYRRHDVQVFEPSSRKQTKRVRIALLV